MARKKGVQRAKAALDRGAQRQQQVQLQHIIETQVRFWAGPLPAPEILQEYNVVIPGGADRIISMAEKQADHRRYLEKITVEGGINRATRGQYLAFILGLAGIVGGVFLIFSGKSAEGLAAVITSLAALTGTFLIGRIAARRQLAQKDPSGS